jgi:hypothetical protein
MLTETLGLTGTKVSSDKGACGCCAVLMNEEAKEEERGHFLGLDQAADGNIPKNRFQGLLVHAFYHGGSRIARCHRHTADP